MLFTYELKETSICFNFQHVRDIIDLYILIYGYKTDRTCIITKILLKKTVENLDIYNDITGLKNEVFLIFSNRLKEELYFNPLKARSSHILVESCSVPLQLEVFFAHPPLPPKQLLTRVEIKQIIITE